MKQEKDMLYRMPLVMGSLLDLADPQARQLVYPRVEALFIQYETDPAAIPPLLPEAYRPAANPTVTVFFSHNSQLPFMAGRAYWMAAVQVAAAFDGEQDQVEGEYTVAMFENQVWPILGGREDLGMPKLYADFSPVRLLPNSRLRCETSLWGHLLFGIELAKPRKQNAIVRMVANRMVNVRPWLGYKYIPSLDGPPDADYPTISWNNTKIDELFFCKSAEIFCGTASPEDIGETGLVVHAIRSLPIVKLERAAHFHGSAVLRYDLSRRLR